MESFIIKNNINVNTILLYFIQRIDINYLNNFLINKEYKKLIYILKYIEIRKYNNNDIIFNIKDEADGMYIVLHGNVDVYIIDKNCSQQEISPTESQKHIRKKELITQLGKDFYEKHKNNQNMFDNTNNIFKMRHVKTFNYGSHFGDLGLLQRNNTRNATCIAKSGINKLNGIEDDNIILAFINKKIFNDYLKIDMNLQEEKEINILKAFFEHKINREKIIYLKRFLTTRKYIYRNKLYNISDDINKIYFIIKGEVKVLLLVI